MSKLDRTVEDLIHGCVVREEMARKDSFQTLVPPHKDGDEEKVPKTLVWEHRAGLKRLKVNSILHR